MMKFRSMPSLTSINNNNDDDEERVEEDPQFLPIDKDVGIRTADEVLRTADDKGVDESSTLFLSRSARTRLFAVAFIIGLILSITGTILFAMRSERLFFVILYLSGTFLQILSTFLLAGPLEQAERLLHPLRWIAAVLVLLSLFLVPFFTFHLGDTKFCLVIVIIHSIQILTMLIYTLSNVRWAREAFNRLTDRIFG